MTTTFRSTLPWGFSESNSDITLNVEIAQCRHCKRTSCISFSIAFVQDRDLFFRSDTISLASRVYAFHWLYKRIAFAFTTLQLREMFFVLFYYVFYSFLSDFGTGATVLPETVTLVPVIGSTPVVPGPIGPPGQPNPFGPAGPPGPAQNLSRTFPSNGQMIGPPLANLTLLTTTAASTTTTSKPRKHYFKGIGLWNDIFWLQKIAEQFILLLILLKNEKV